MKLRKFTASFIASSVLVIPYGTGMTTSADETTVDDKLAVTFDAGVGTVDYTEMKAENGKIYGALPIPVLEGYVFEGGALGYGGRVAMSCEDYYGECIVRLTPADGDTGWDGYTSTLFRKDYTIYLDVTLNDVTPIGLDVNDRKVDSSMYSIEGNRIHAAITIDDSIYYSNFCFVDIHSDAVSSDYTVNSFFVGPTEQYMITPESVVMMGEDHILHAVWKSEADIYQFGDPTGDGKIDAKDASFILAEYARLSTSEDAEPLPQAIKEAADVNGDGKLDAKDASTTLFYYSYTSTGGSKTLSEFLEDNTL